MTRLRFRLWLFGQRVCDVLGPSVDAVILRIPVVRDHLGACVIFHGVMFRGEVPDSWWPA